MNTTYFFSFLPSRLGSKNRVELLSPNQDTGMGRRGAECREPHHRGSLMDKPEEQ